MPGKRYTIPDALFELFGVRLAKESPALKNVIYSLIRNGVVAVDAQPRIARKALFVQEAQMPALHNAVLLQALFGSPRVVKGIFDDPSVRRKHAGLAGKLFFERDSLVGIGFRAKEAGEFVVALEGEFDLRQSYLPNPYEVLPQVVLGNNSGLLTAVLAQAGSLSRGDNMLLAYLQGDIATAHHLAETMGPARGELEILRRRVLDAYREAEEFDNLLDMMRSGR